MGSIDGERNIFRRKANIDKLEMLMAQCKSEMPPELEEIFPYKSAELRKKCEDTRQQRNINKL